ncbi:MAG: YjjG family noncanonical pyrimidine nucleotidase [Clostridia bacterium]|nr:YjjG family noncanonical pyrimidine nucleotidase [Clostridia bacterium]
MLKYDTILFDADGTLFDFFRSEREALISVFKIYGYELTDEEVREYSAINDSLWKALERREVTKEELRIKRFELFCESRGFVCDCHSIAKDYTDMLSKQHFLIDGALEICRTLSEFCRLFIITNGIEYVQKNRMELSPLKEYFDALFISGEIGYEKPSVHFFDAVKRGISDFSSERSLVVGDSLTSDMKGGIDAGVDCCYFDPKGNGIPQNMPIKYRIEKLSELQKIILTD